jgi:SEC-C motif-containing protein
MTVLSPWLDELLACEDDDLPDELVERIVARGDAAREALLAVATDAPGAAPGRAVTRLARVHALDVLAERPPDAATAARLVDALAADPASDLADEIADTLAAMGDVVTAPALAALAAADDAELAGALAWIVADACEDPARTYDALATAFERFPGHVAAALGHLGDGRAIPALRRALAAHEVGRGGAEHEEDCIEIADAVEALGGSLDASEEAKLCRAIARHDRLLARRVPRIEEALADAEQSLLDPGRNDPCPCGSGRKFKKCHEGDAEFDRRAADPAGDDDADRNLGP